MSASDRLDLKRLIQNQGDDYKDNTDGIRRLKHSSLILADVQKIENIKKTMATKRKTRNQEYVTACQVNCSFLFNKYTDIFNRLIKDELDLDLLSDMLMTLQKIEDGKLDQQEGSVIIGKILHKIYVESALKKCEHIDDEEQTTKIPRVDGKTINWTEYKRKKINDLKITN